MGQVKRLAIAIGKRADNHACELAVAVKHRSAGFAFLRTHAHDHGVRVAKLAVFYRAAKAHRFDRAKAGRIALRMGLAEGVKG